MFKSGTQWALKAVVLVAGHAGRWAAGAGHPGGLRSARPDVAVHPASDQLSEEEGEEAKGDGIEQGPRKISPRPQKCAQMHKNAENAQKKCTKMRSQMEKWTKWTNGFWTSLSSKNIFGQSIKFWSNNIIFWGSKTQF